MPRRLPRDVARTCLERREGFEALNIIKIVLELALFGYLVWRDLDTRDLVGFMAEWIEEMESRVKKIEQDIRIIQNRF